MIKMILFPRSRPVVPHIHFNANAGITAGSLAGCLETTHLWPAHPSSATWRARTGDTKLGLDWDPGGW